MVFAVGRARPALNRNEFWSRPASSLRALPLFSFSPRQSVRAPLNRNVFAERPRHSVGFRPGPVAVRTPSHVRYPLFSRPVVILTGSWTPAVSLALAILGIGLLTSLCFPEAAPVIMPVSIAFAVTVLFLKAFAGRR